MTTLIVVIVVVVVGGVVWMMTKKNKESEGETGGDVEKTTEQEQKSDVDACCGSTEGSCEKKSLNEDAEVQADTEVKEEAKKDIVSE